MNPASCALLMVLAATIEGGQHRTITVEPGKRIEVDVPGALMAFARDYSNAAVLAEDGEVLILAKKPGKTEIVVITGSHVVKFDLLVTGERRRIATSTLVPIRPEPPTIDDIIPPAEIKAPPPSPRRVPSKPAPSFSPPPPVVAKNERARTPARILPMPPRPVVKDEAALPPPQQPAETQPAHTLTEQDIPPVARKNPVPENREPQEAVEQNQPTADTPQRAEPSPSPAIAKPSPPEPPTSQNQNAVASEPPPAPKQAATTNPAPSKKENLAPTVPLPHGHPEPITDEHATANQIPLRIPDETVDVTSNFEEVPTSPLGLFNNFLQLREGRTTALQVPGITAAVSVDPSVVDVVVSRDTLTVFGKSPGKADILVMTPEGTRMVPVVITVAPPSFPHGFIAPVSALAESGEYEFRFNSDREQIQNRLHFTMRRPGRTTEFNIVTAKFLGGVSGYETTTLPSAFYRITTPDWKLGLLDETVNNSPLTVNQSTLRGLHLDIGRWTLHAGYSPMVTFNNFLIPTQKELAGGISYSEPLSAHSKLTGSFYYFHLPEQTFNLGRSGAVGSLLYHLQRPDGWDISAELGFSRGPAGSAEIQFRNAKDYLDVTFQAKPEDYPALTIGNLPGTVYGVTWNHNLTPALTTDVNIFGNHLVLPNSEQSNLSAAANVLYRFARRWSVSPGEVYARFSQSSPAGDYSIRTLSFPQQINFDTAHFGASLQYQPTLTSGGYALGQSVRASSRLTFGTLQLSGYAERETQALSVSSILAQIPALQLELQRLGITISDPQQLSSLLQDDAFLQTLGLSQGAILHVVPLRRQLGANFTWASHASRPQRLTLDYVRSTDELLQGSIKNWVQSGSYSLPIGSSNEIFFSYSWFHYPGLNRQYAPLAEIGFRHTFHALPSFLDPIRHGTITGIVYLDEQRKGAYATTMPAMEAVEVVLDGVTTTRTDRNGRYAFSGVPRGAHTVEIHFHADHPFWFTSPSTTTAEINAATNFGITFAASELIGSLKNDAAVGVPDIEVNVWGPEQNFKAKTDADGRFALAGLAPGDYTVNIDAESVPPGYILDEFKPLRVQLQKGVPRRVELQLRAIRTFLGEATWYNPVVGLYVPLVKGHVTIPKLGLQTTTDAQGNFRFNNLPAGDYTIIVSGAAFSMTNSITLPTGPANLKEVFRIPTQ